MSYLVVGASSGLGREIAYTFAKEKNDLILVSRDQKDLSAIESDLKIRFKVKVKSLNLDFSSTNEIDSKMFSKDEIYKDLKGVLFPVGYMFDTDNVNLKSKDSQDILYANYLSISHTILQLKKYLSSNNSFSIVGFGSVSGILGRKLNSNYSAAKRSLESYFESLAFENLNTKTTIQFYVLGYLDTNLSFGKNLKLPKGSTRRLSEIVYRNINKKFKKKYFPFFWSIIVLILKLVPFFILLKLNKFFK